MPRLVAVIASATDILKIFIVASFEERSTDGELD